MDTVMKNANLPRLVSV